MSVGRKKKIVGPTCQWVPSSSPSTDDSASAAQRTFSSLLAILLSLSRSLAGRREGVGQLLVRGAEKDAKREKGGGRQGGRRQAQRGKMAAVGEGRHSPPPSPRTLARFPHVLPLRSSRRLLEAAAPHPLADEGAGDGRREHGTRAAVTGSKICSVVIILNFIFMRPSPSSPHPRRPTLAATTLSDLSRRRIRRSYLSARWSLRTAT
jgi:hypothetical protein